MIVKIAHYIWIGGEMPSFQKGIISKSREILLQQGFKIIIWDEEKILEEFGKDFPSFVKSAIEQKKYAIAVDYFRLLIIYKYGGIYIDCDHEIIRDIPQFVLDSSIFCGKIPAGFLNNGFFGANKNHKTIKKIIKETDRVVTPQNMIVGPRVETLFIFGNILERDKEALLLDSEYLYPIFPGEKTEGVTKKTFGVHYFAGSWMKKWYLDLLYKLGLPKIALFIRNFTSDNKHF